MSDNFELTDTKSYWFVGAVHNGQDQTARFIAEGIWEINTEGKQTDLVKSIKAGEKIAIKSSYTRKNDLPFDNRGHTVSVMAIKAVGTVVENVGDGQTLKVDWEKDIPLREWYFFTSRNTVWKIIPETWARANLIDFAFHGKEQDIDRFRNDPYWRERFGDSTTEDSSFEWTLFYEEVADRLLTFRGRRDELIAGIHEISNSRLVDIVSLIDRHSENQPGVLLKDICPFTIMQMFNRGPNSSNRQAVARKLALFLGVSAAIPDNFDEIPQVRETKWFFGHKYQRKERDIEILWDLFAKAICHADMIDECEDTRSQFANAFDKAIAIYGLGWKNLTTSLFWIRPWFFLNLGSKEREYISKKLNYSMNRGGQSIDFNSSDYLVLMERIEARFQEDSYPVHSFPELSLAALKYISNDTNDDSTKSWRDNLRNKIKRICNEKSSNEFTRQEFLKRFTNELELEFPNNTKVGQTVSQQFQKLRDNNELEFIDLGSYRWLSNDVDNEEEFNHLDLDIEDQTPQAFHESYTADNIITDGCFLDKSKVEKTLKRLSTKKNIILQGPPGTGKTWLAKRLAFALIGQRDDSKIRAVQFHPNLSYEDFIRGWRPSGEGKLTLVDGPFMEVITTAIDDPESKYVIVIEEINRGNPAQVFGEMLTLLETDKRTPDEALELSYRKSAGERVYIPSNLYVIGTMNIADRSLALVDLALRRRFAFIDLEPTLGKSWRDWVKDKNGIDSEFLYEIERRIINLNDEIAIDPSLGAQFQVGHSYVTPAIGMNITEAKEWFGEVVETEIGPLLDEYWFDDLEKSRKAQKRLIEGL